MTGFVVQNALIRSLAVKPIESRVGKSQEMPNKTISLSNWFLGTPPIGFFLSFQPVEVSRLHRALDYRWRVTFLS